MQGHGPAQRFEQCHPLVEQRLDALALGGRRRRNALLLDRSLLGLEGRRLVTSRWGEPTGERGGRRRRYYSLTSAGATTLHRSYRQLRRMADDVLPELETLVDQGRSS